MSHFLFGCLLFAGAALAAELPPIPIWPHGAPGEKGDIGEEVDTTKPTDKLAAGKRYTRLGNVTNPTLAIYRPPAEKDTGAAVLVFPGGSYRILSMDLEGSEVCEWLNSIGVTGILLKYRVPARQGGPQYAAPLQDAQRAIGLVRSRAAEWHLDPKRIGVLGFSAGGHLAGAVSNNFDSRTYPAVDAADQISCRPDFSLLIYPAYMAVPEQVGQLKPEIHVTPNTPPAFLVQTEDDPVRVENVLYYCLALRNAKVPAELHVYATGGHGYGLRATAANVTGWPALAEKWLRTNGYLQPAQK